MKGSAGPSGMDAVGWRRLCTVYGSASQDLCESIAACARRLATSYVDPDSLTALISGRLIPLNKNPGVRPIGIGETIRRIMCKAILKVVKPIIQSTVGTAQLCAGLESGCEAGVAAMNRLYNDDSTEAILLVDASNAFNSLNRMAMLHNLQSICPALAPVTINMYRNSPSLIVGGETIYSCEGTTQGDPLAMPLYALCTLPLINKVATDGVNHIWYADDAGAGGKISDLKEWWTSLQSCGPAYGYFPNGLKSWLVVKDKFVEMAESAFEGTEINITTEGRPYLGSAIGTSDFTQNFVTRKIIEWSSEVESLCTYALPHPQAAYTVLSLAMLNKWTYLTRTMQCSSEQLKPLETAIRVKLLPVLTGRPAPNDTERDLLALPARLGGIGITNPVYLCKNYNDCNQIIKPLVDAILDCQNDIERITADCKKMKTRISKDKTKYLLEKRETIRSRLSPDQERALHLASEKGASSWLTVIPMTAHGFCLQKREFRDGLCLRYGWRPPNLQSTCTCGKDFNVEHALSCPTGGYPIIRHNEIRNNVADMLKEVCPDVSLEPVLQPLTGEQLSLASSSREDGARLDVAARGFYGSKFERAFLDIRVFNPLARSNRQSSIESTYKKQEQEKRRKYEQRIRETENASFIPFVMSCTGGYGQSAKETIKRLASMLAEKRRVPYSKMIAWIRTRLSFAMLRSCILCLRGARNLRDITKNPADSNSCEAAVAECQISQF